MTVLERMRSAPINVVAEHLKELARIIADQSGEMNLYELWCDNSGACANMDDKTFEEVGCTDEMHKACICRFLNREVSQCPM